MLPDTATPGGDRKRRRIAIACNECRDRKRKCDGVKPVCGSCAKRASATPCVWDEGRNAKGWSNSYVESLRSRIHELEQHHATNNSSTASRPSAGRTDRSTHAAPSTASSVQFMSEAAEGPGPGALAQAGVSQGTVEMLLGNTIRALDSGPSYRGPGDRGHDAHAEAALSDRHSIVDGDELDDESGIDAMGVFGSIADREGRRASFFGPSSTLSFLSQARRAMSQSTVGTANDQDRNSLLGLFQDEGVSVGGSSQTALMKPRRATFGLDGHRLSIPPRKQADALLDSYWTYFHSLYPVLHQPSFTDRYLTIWTPSSNNGPELNRRKGYYTELDGKLFHCLLNLAFALGAQFGPAENGDHQRQLSLIFFERAKDLLDFDTLARGDIYLVQTLILLGHYLQGTDMASACWNMVGLAIRAAQGIGLHHEPESCEQGCCSQGKLSQLKTEMRRRAWTSCILLDRVFSMTYGRPLMIHPAASRSNLSLSGIDDEFLSDDPAAPGTQPEVSLSLTECYVQAIKLQNILGQVLSTLYKDSGDMDFSFVAASTANDKLKRGELQTLLSMDNSLSAWEQDLPDHLNARTYSFMGLNSSRLFGTRTPTFNRQAIILHARYLHVRLIMFRPVLSAVFHDNCKDTTSEQDSSMEAAMRQGMLDKGINLCVSSARDLVELISGNLDLCSEVLPPSWHNVFYMHSCSIVFLICRLCCLNRIEDREGLIASWTKCLAFFYSYQSRSRSAKRCLRIMQAIQARAFPSDPGSTNANYQMPHGQLLTPLLDENVFTGQESTNWIGDPSEMNWLSIFPFVEDIGDGPSDPQFRESPYY
ncbi:fungal-specific transcription factor domain-containing protein [Aspergillus carlsbadensis]|nr:fungal-specific transcription factor domain-containing protein [Aspergillus carlsbadensis]